jgi:hypothetical protein
MTTLADLRTYVARDLRDVGNDTWDVSELDDLINRGIDALADVYPKQIVTSIATVTTGTYTYSAGTLMSVYRLDVYSSAGSYRETIERGSSDHPDAGWELHGGTLYLPVGMTLTTGDTIRAFGYGRYVQLAASSATTDLDSSGIWAVRVFAEAEALAGLIANRAAFQQWQENSNNTDVTALGLAQLYGQARDRWEMERRRLRRLRK